MISKQRSLSEPINCSSWPDISSLVFRVFLSIIQKLELTSFGGYWYSSLSLPEISAFQQPVSATAPYTWDVVLYFCWCIAPAPGPRSRRPWYFLKGSNWAMMLLHSIVHTVHNKEPPPIIPLIEFRAANKLERLKAEPSPRALGTHLNYDYIPQSFFEKKVKMLVVFRNPKDTAASLFHFYNNNPMLPTYNSWDDFFPDFMAGKVIFGSYFDHAVAWNKHLDDTNLLLTFEDMKEDLQGSIKKISEFFGLSLTEAQVNEISDKGTFKFMKENSKQTHGEFGKVIFRKGEVRDWKNHFSEAQSQEMDAKFEACLAGTKIGEMLKYNVHCKW
ncbi:sulfotransferase 6B1-like isoform X1 [Pseudophryne corroboree]|uniref:sulfotransferase 6B1-like isoform X1 n=1 Tax=Pseudophryne corroboree TaxID=495146 RepID=UPI0030817979